MTHLTMANAPGIVIDVWFVPSTSTRREHRAALRDCLPSLVVLVLATVMLAFGLFAIDENPHTPPMYPKSVSLAIGAGLAVSIMSVAIGVRYRQHLTASRRRD